jgi:hypothetical protein
MCANVMGEGGEGKRKKNGCFFIGFFILHYIAGLLCVLYYISIGDKKCINGRQKKEIIDEDFLLFYAN